MQIIKEVCDTFDLSLSSFYRIKNNKAKPPSKTQLNKFKYTYCDNDFELII